MSLAPFEVYCAEASDQTHQLRRWVVRAVFLSLALHAGLLAVFHFTKLEAFQAAEQVSPSEPAMTLWHVVNLPDTAEPEARFVPEAEPAPVVPVPIPIETPRAETPGVMPPVEIFPPALGNDTPAGIGGIDFGAGMDVQAALDNQLREATNGLMGKGERVNNDLAAQSAPEVKDLQGGADSAAGLPERQTIEKLLENPGPLPAGGAAVDVPGGALFEYNSSDLRPQAIDQLTKLGEFIRSHPDATVSIEGHADAIGAPEYNQALSEKRAESVRTWLVQHMGVSPERIQTRGFGSSHLRVPADATIDEQQPNRRVEIVIKSGK